MEIVETILQVLLGSLSGIPPLSILAPVDVLTALILEWPQLGGAIQQDAGEVLQRLRIAPVTGVALPPHTSTICVEGITLTELDVDTLQKASISLQHLWDNVVIYWDSIPCHPSCVVVVFLRFIWLVTEDIATRVWW